MNSCIYQNTFYSKDCSILQIYAVFIVRKSHHPYSRYTRSLGYYVMSSVHVQTTTSYFILSKVKVTHWWSIHRFVSYFQGKEIQLGKKKLFAKGQNIVDPTSIPGSPSFISLVVKQQGRIWLVSRLLMIWIVIIRYPGDLAWDVASVCSNWVELWYRVGLRPLPNLYPVHINITSFNKPWLGNGK